jgi:hypothetical protein
VAESYSLTIVFRPGMYPADRHEIEEELESVLGETAEIVGGGTMMDLSESDVQLDVSDLDAALAAIRSVLQRRQIPDTTRIYQIEPEQVEYCIYP